jgi:hypothetical protein
MVPYADGTMPSQTGWGDGEEEEEEEETHDAEEV